MRLKQHGRADQKFLLMYNIIPLIEESSYNDVDILIIALDFRAAKVS